MSEEQQSLLLGAGATAGMLLLLLLLYDVFLCWCLCSRSLLQKCWSRALGDRAMSGTRCARVTCSAECEEAEEEEEEEEEKLKDAQRELEAPEGATTREKPRRKKVRRKKSRSRSESSPLARHRHDSLDRNEERDLETEDGGVELAPSEADKAKERSAERGRAPIVFDL